MSTLLSDKVMNVWENLVFTKADNKIYYTSSGSDSEITTLASNLTLSGRLTLSNVQVLLSGVSTGTTSETLTHLVMDSGNKIEYLSSGDLATYLPLGWHGSSTLMKILPTEFMADAGGTNYVFGSPSGVKKITLSAKLYVSKAIPTGYGITKVQVHANNSTSSVVDTYSVNYTTGAKIALTGGLNQDFNEEFSVSLTSSTANYFLLETEPTASPFTDIIYGATITLERV